MSIKVEKTDEDTHKSIAGVTFELQITKMN